MPTPKQIQQQLTGGANTVPSVWFWQGFGADGLGNVRAADGSVARGIVSGNELPGFGDEVAFIPGDPVGQVFVRRFVEAGEVPSQTDATLPHKVLVRVISTGQHYICGDFAPIPVSGLQPSSDIVDFKSLGHNPNEYFLFYVDNQQISLGPSGFRVDSTLTTICPTGELPQGAISLTGGPSGGDGSGENFGGGIGGWQYWEKVFNRRSSGTPFQTNIGMNWTTQGASTGEYTTGTYWFPSWETMFFNDATWPNAGASSLAAIRKDGNRSYSGGLAAGGVWDEETQTRLALQGDDAFTAATWLDDEVWSLGSETSVRQYSAIADFGAGELIVTLLATRRLSAVRYPAALDDLNILARSYHPKSTYTG